MSRLHGQNGREKEGGKGGKVPLNKGRFPKKLGTLWFFPLVRRTFLVLNYYKAHVEFNKSNFCSAPVSYVYMYQILVYQANLK